MRRPVTALQQGPSPRQRIERRDFIAAPIRPRRRRQLPRRAKRRMLARAERPAVEDQIVAEPEPPIADQDRARVVSEAERVHAAIPAASNPRNRHAIYQDALSTQPRIVA